MNETSEKSRKDNCSGERKSKPEDFICKTHELNERLPVDPELATLCDMGEIEKFDKNYVDGCIELLEHKLKSE